MTYARWSGETPRSGFAAGSAAIQENHGEVVKMLRFLAEAVAAYSATTAQDQQQQTTP